MDALLRQVDEELGKTKKINGGPFFLGPNVSMVDCMFAPFLERMAASLPYYKVIDLDSNSATHPSLFFPVASVSQYIHLTVLFPGFHCTM